MNEKPQTPDSPFVIERLMRDARRGFEDEEFSSEEDFRDKMHTVVDEGMPKNRLEALKDIPVELAQELPKYGAASGHHLELQMEVQQ